MTSILAKEDNRSRQWKKYEKAKRYIRSKSEKQLRDQLHKTTKNFVDWCNQQSVSDVYLGEVEGVQRDTRKKRNKVSSRNFRSPCGYTEHRDVLGARNILSKGMYGDIRHFEVVTKTTYLRIA